MANNSHYPNKIFARFVLVTVVLALFVVVLGAYTRLVDAGLGCPDWPACYGQVTVPETQQQIQQAEMLYPDRPVEQAKAWTEMVHRYFASTLGFLILLMACFAVKKSFQVRGFPVVLPIALLILVIFQGLLGMWTVTLRLQPTIVMGHLLGGYTTFTLLWVLYLRLCRQRGLDLPPADSPVQRLASCRPWVVFGLLLLIVQIILGAWTSTNYAGLSCPDFPYCQGKLLPQLDFAQAFHFWPTVGPDYEGGLLDNAARMTINTVHRFMAVLVGFYFLLLNLCILRKSRGSCSIKMAALVVLVLLGVQIALGILNVVYNLPLALAVAHNGVGALLLASVVTLVFVMYQKHPGNE